MIYNEPTHDSSARTTATSAAEGRFKVGVSGKMKREKRKRLKKIIDKRWVWKD